jgi:hypothetical protein
VQSTAIACKPVRLTLVGEEAVPEGTQRTACLTSQQLRSIADLGRRVEALYGTPQDIEWAIAGGEIALLQSRPVTAAGDERDRVRRSEIARLEERAMPEGTVWARYSLAEVLPEPLPFTWGLWRQFMTGQGGYGRMYRELGYDPDPCLDQDGVLDLIAGRPYFNLGREARLYFRHFPLEYPFAKLRSNPEQAIYPVLETNLARAPRGFLPRSVGVARQMMAAEQILERAALEAPEQLERSCFPRMAEFAREMRATELAGLSDQECLAALEQCRVFLFDEFAPQALKPGVLAGLATRKLEATLRPAMDEARARAAVEAALSGVAPAPEYDLGGGLRQVSNGGIPLPEFLECFGHRGPGEMELANPRWRETPNALLAQLQTIPSSPSISCLDPTEALLAHLPPGRRFDARKAALYLERARRFTALREAAKHHLMLGCEGSSWSWTGGAASTEASSTWSPTTCRNWWRERTSRPASQHAAGSASSPSTWRPHACSSAMTWRPSAARNRRRSPDRCWRGQASPRASRRAERWRCARPSRLRRTRGSSSSSAHRPIPGGSLSSCAPAAWCWRRGVSSRTGRSWRGSSACRQWRISPMPAGD